MTSEKISSNICVTVFSESLSLVELEQVYGPSDFGFNIGATNKAGRIHTDSYWSQTTEFDCTRDIQDVVVSALNRIEIVNQEQEESGVIRFVLEIWIRDRADWPTFNLEPKVLKSLSDQNVSLGVYCYIDE